MNEFNNNNSQELKYLREDIQDLKNAVRDLTNEMRKDYIRKEKYDPEQKAQDWKIDSLLRSRSWIVSIVIGTLVSGAIGILIGRGAL